MAVSVVLLYGSKVYLHIFSALPIPVFWPRHWFSPSDVLNSVVAKITLISESVFEDTLCSSLSSPPFGVNSRGVLSEDAKQQNKERPP